jgi:hypothetical protein
MPSATRISLRAVHCLLLAATFAAHAAGPPDGRGPPPEALAACKSESAGAVCSFTGRDGQQLQGACWAPEGKPLACRPKDAPPPPGNNAPPK